VPVPPPAALRSPVGLGHHDLSAYFQPSNYGVLAGFDGLSAAPATSSADYGVEEDASSWWQAAATIAPASSPPLGSLPATSSSEYDQVPVPIAPPAVVPPPQDAAAAPEVVPAAPPSPYPKLKSKDPMYLTESTEGFSELQQILAKGHQTVGQYPQHVPTIDVYMKTYFGWGQADVDKHIHGKQKCLVSYLDPALISPAWLAGSMHTTYLLAKTINVVVMTLVAVPVYLWGIRIAPRRYVLVAVALTLLIPSFFYTGELMTENAFAMTFVLACFAMALVLERPALSRQVLSTSVASSGALPQAMACESFSTHSRRSAFWRTWRQMTSARRSISTN
jgi:hypothetical protein